METWLDIEQRFRTLAEPLRFLRLDVQWGGSTGEGWHLAGMGRTSVVAEFEALSAIAGDALVKAFAGSPQKPDWLSDPESDRRWFRALKEQSRAIEKLTQAVTESRQLQHQEKTIVLEQLEELSKQAVLAPDQRLKPGVLNAVLNGIATTLGAAGGFAEVWSMWGQVLMRFFGL
jgi:hypothetical protein